ncbi:hypothetical protein X741_21685 [Mesorhizobium sp. LNHC229A00]|nr:hypothetical protein X741_21685 [Mesorhizobium sp. LNHC229A00]
MEIGCIDLPEHILLGSLTQKINNASRRTAVWAIGRRRQAEISPHLPCGAHAEKDARMIYKGKL